jgi:hypothetical protein
MEVEVLSASMNSKYGSVRELLDVRTEDPYPNPGPPFSEL